MKISVIIPVYNAARYLRECLDSVLAAARTLIEKCKVNSEKCGVEIICVDDGSTDGSGAILDEIQEKIKSVIPNSSFSPSNFHVIHQNNAGAWAARNAALDVAQGEWVTFVDADDVLNPNWLQSYVDLAEKTGADLVRQRFTYGKKMPADFFARIASEKCEVFDGDVARAWMWNTMAASGFMCLVAVRKKIIANGRFPPTNCKEDSLWLLRLTPRVGKVVQGEFAGYFYRATEGSLMKRNRKVSQCVFYLKEMLALWQSQRAMAEKGGFVNAVIKNIRASVDNDVIEWAMKCAPEDDMPRRAIRGAYNALEDSGALAAPYANRKRYRLGFWWWRHTGQVWAIKIPGFVFLFLRQVINRCKSKS